MNIFEENYLISKRLYNYEVNNFIKKIKKTYPLTTVIAEKVSLQSSYLWIIETHDIHEKVLSSELAFIDPVSSFNNLVLCPKKFYKSDLIENINNYSYFNATAELVIQYAVTPETRYLVTLILNNDNLLKNKFMRSDNLVKDFSKLILLADKYNIWEKLYSTISYLRPNPIPENCKIHYNQLINHLSLKEKAIFEQFQMGVSNAGEIGKNLGFSKRTAEKHLEHIKVKLNISHKYQLYHLAKSLSQFYTF